ncbi:protein of unknown function [Candidatus Promineifilum breve]|nr:protein of unknown function [Candidatus Promineifilum breve]CUS06362.1 protein of unknown function [Candidatus Promineifilum breve]
MFIQALSVVEWPTIPFVLAKGLRVGDLIYVSGVATPRGEDRFTLPVAFRQTLPPFASPFKIQGARRRR